MCAHGQRCLPLDAALLRPQRDTTAPPAWIVGAVPCMSTASPAASTRTRCGHHAAHYAVDNVVQLLWFTVGIGTQRSSPIHSTVMVSSCTAASSSSVFFTSGLFPALSPFLLFSSNLFYGVSSAAPLSPSTLSTPPSTTSLSSASQSAEPHLRLDQALSLSVAHSYAIHVHRSCSFHFLPLSLPVSHTCTFSLLTSFTPSPSPTPHLLHPLTPSPLTSPSLLTSFTPSPSLPSLPPSPLTSPSSLTFPSLLTSFNPSPNLPPTPHLLHPSLPSSLLSSFTPHLPLPLPLHPLTSPLPLLQSVQHENTYRNPKAKYCYGADSSTLLPDIRYTILQCSLTTT